MNTARKFLKTFLLSLLAMVLVMASLIPLAAPASAVEAVDNNPDNLILTKTTEYLGDYVPRYPYKPQFHVKSDLVADILN